MREHLARPAIAACTITPSPHPFNDVMVTAPRGRQTSAFFPPRRGASMTYDKTALWGDSRRGPARDIALRPAWFSRAAHRGCLTNEEARVGPQTAAGCAWLEGTRNSLRSCLDGSAPPGSELRPMKAAWERRASVARPWLALAKAARRGQSCSIHGLDVCRCLLN